MDFARSGRALIWAPPVDATLTRRAVRVVKRAIALFHLLNGIAIKRWFEVGECCRLLIANILEAYPMWLREVRSVIDLILPEIQCKAVIAFIVASIDARSCVRAEWMIEYPPFFDGVNDLDPSTEGDHHWQLLVRVLQLIRSLQVLILEHTVEGLSSAAGRTCPETHSKTRSCKQCTSSCCNQLDVPLDHAV